MDKNQIIRTGCFILILIILFESIEKIIQYGVTQSPYSYYYKIGQILEHKADPEISLFGSSVGEVAMNANQLEHSTHRTAYNFCIDGTRFMQYNGLIKELNQYSVNCKLVVLTETFFSLSKVDQLTEPDRFIAYVGNNNIYNSLHEIQPGLVWKLRYVPFYDFVVAKNSYYKASFMGLKNAFRSTAWSDSLQGFTPKYKEWEAGLDLLNKKSKAIEIVIDSATIRAYNKTISELTSKGRKVLIIIPPIQEEGLLLLGGMARLRKTLSSMQREGVYFRDYSQCDLSLEKKYFYNNSHVNERGAKVFTERLGLTIDSLLTEQF